MHSPDMLNSPEVEIAGRRNDGPPLDPTVIGDTVQRWTQEHGSSSRYGDVDTDEDARGEGQLFIDLAPKTRRKRKPVKKRRSVSLSSPRANKVKRQSPGSNSSKPSSPGIKPKQLPASRPTAKTRSRKVVASPGDVGTLVPKQDCCLRKAVDNTRQKQQVQCCSDKVSFFTVQVAKQPIIIALVCPM